MPIIHTLFSNVKSWIAGTHHGVSKKHLPRYLREWNYRFNRRWGVGQLEDFLLRRAATRGTITYRQLVNGEATAGSPALRTTKEAQLLLPLPPPVPLRPTDPAKSLSMSKKPPSRATDKSNRSKG